MTELGFLSPDRARGDVLFTSPLRRALEGATAVRDLSELGKIEVRGDVASNSLLLEDLGPGTHVVRITPERALVLCPYEQCAELRAELRRRFRTIIDVTGALAGLELDGERAMRRLTDLNLDALPAVGKVADVPAVVLRDGDRFRLFFPQEFGHAVAEIVLDTLAGLA